MPVVKSVNWTNFKALLLTEIEVANAGRFILDDTYVCQEKHNGHRRVIVSENDGQTLYMMNRVGVRRTLPGPIAMVLRRLKKNFVLDGEMLTGGTFIMFDLLSYNGLDCMTSPYRARLQFLNDEFTNIHPLLQVTFSAFTQEEKMHLLAKLDAENAEGGVFKSLDAPYTQGKGGDNWKLKFWKTLSAIVGDRSIDDKTGGIKDGVDVLLYDAKGCLNRISGCSLIGRYKVAKGDVIEVKYLYGTGDGHIVQPVMIMKRDDIAPAECTMTQIKVSKNWSANA